jgi:hypothetical protein
MQLALFDEQQGDERNDAARDRDGAQAGKQSRCKHHEGRDLRRPVDVMTTACDVRGGNDHDRAGEQNRRRGRDASGPQPSTEPPDRAEHREGPDAREACTRTLGVT